MLSSSRGYVAAQCFSIVSVPHCSFALQVGSPRLTSVARDFDPSYSMEVRTTEVDEECSGSIQGDCVPSQFSKPYLMHSATDAASAIVDFSKGNIEDGVVNSPPSRGAVRTPVCSPSPLRGCGWTAPEQRSCLLMEKTVRAPQRVLYSKHPECSVEDAKEIGPLDSDKEVRVEPASKRLESLSHGPDRHEFPDGRGRFRRTQSLTRQPSQQLSTRGCVSSGRNAYSVRRQSYPEPSLFTLIRQSRERDRASSGVSRPNPYSRRDEIMRGIAKLKSGKLDTAGVNQR